MTKTSVGVAQKGEYHEWKQSSGTAIAAVGPGAMHCIGHLCQSGSVAGNQVPYRQDL